MKLKLIKFNYVSSDFRQEEMIPYVILAWFEAILLRNIIKSENLNGPLHYISEYIDHFDSLF